MSSVVRRLFSAISLIYSYLSSLSCPAQCRLALSGRSTRSTRSSWSTRLSASMAGGKRQELNDGHWCLVYNSMCSRTPEHILIEGIPAISSIPSKEVCKKVQMPKQWQTRQIKDLPGIIEGEVRDQSADWLSSKFLINISKGTLGKIALKMLN